MSIKIVKKCFKSDEELIDKPPLLCRQVATIITYNELLNKYIDSAHEINDYLRQQAYSRECLKECLSKYGDYKNYKKIFYSSKLFKKIMEDKLPFELILKIINYLY
jgi:hypothetical protein